MCESVICQMNIQMIFCVESREYSGMLLSAGYSWLAEVYAESRMQHSVNMYSVCSTCTGKSQG